MSVRVRDLFMQELGDLRYEPIEKRIRGMIAGRPVLDSTRAMLVWEPKRVVPSYAVPIEDIAASVIPAPARESFSDPGGGGPMLGNRPVLDPSVPFSVHTAPGEALSVYARGEDEEPVAGFRVTDSALSDYAILDFDAFDAWCEEDEPNIGHPRDPFHRIEIVHSSRHVRVELDGAVLAESATPYLLFEPPLPVRYYLPPGDVRLDRLAPSETTTICAYKGHASYWSHEPRGDVAWTYEEPLREAKEITGRIAFFNEHVDLVIDGTALARPVTPWSRR
ncbi:MAG TPA: DUF427 domain-containing protein [Solirubrobacteraceae bacterium]|jgi:uncharacterized protein (DUF427 family)|nr:DUF427 domain-containing protein [Solirubrobacteraceae bacterium]